MIGTLIRSPCLLCDSCGGFLMATEGAKRAEKKWGRIRIFRTGLRDEPDSEPFGLRKMILIMFILSIFIKASGMLTGCHWLRVGLASLPSAPAMDPHTATCRGSESVPSTTVKVTLPRTLPAVASGASVRAMR